MQQSQFQHPTGYSNAFQAHDVPDNQRLAIEALVSGQKRGEAAQAANVCRKTVQRWLLAPPSSPPSTRPAARPGRRSPASSTRRA